MDPERWKQINEIFHAALDHEPSVRSAYLIEACKDDESLRAEVEALIASHEKESTLFETPASDLAAEFLAKDQTGKIAHYQILKKIGKGGMGEVYLAEDTRLNRKVALKLLPSEFTNDKDRIRRFEREARTVSALNHPNILTIYDIGQIDSSSFIASEYIDGQTLRHRMQSSHLPMKEILAISIQVAEALDAAHQAGVIHRDIKPENIMIRKDGYVKVLDFGLAKSIDPPNTTASIMETGSMAQTQTGIALGTVRYMSPEQARGLKLDSRTDLFSFGIVLYEILAGRPPFEGPTPQDLLVAILEKQPTPLHKLENVSDELQWVVNKALAKEVDERYQSAKDFLADLKRVRKRLDLDEELKRSDPTKISTPAYKRTAFTFVLFIVLVTIALIVFLLTRPTQKKVETSSLPFSKIKLTRLTSSGSAWGSAISRDGRYVVYVQRNEKGQRSLFVKQLSTDSEIQIQTFPQGTTIYRNRRFSLDGDYVYYLTWSWDKHLGSLFQVPVLGGISRKLIEDIDTTPAISPDGKRFAFTRKMKDEHWLMISDIDGSNQRKISSRKNINYVTDLEWSPDGKVIAAILDKHSPSGEAMQIIGVGLDGSEKWLSDLKWTAEWGLADFEWVPDGSGLILSKGELSQRQIYFLPYPKGAVTPIINDPNDYDGVSISADSKTLVTTQNSYDSSIWIASMTKPNSIVQVTTGSNTIDGNTGLSWTPDGKILYHSNAPSGDYQIWRINVDGTNRVRLTSDKYDKFWPVASPDGRYIVYNSDEDNLLKIYRIDSEGSNPKLLSGSRPLRFPRISPDSKWIVCSSADLNKQELIKLSIDDGKATVLASHRYITGSAISPDGKKIGYASQDNAQSDETTIHIISFHAANEITSFKLQTELLAGGRFHWTPDGNGIAYISLDEGPENIYVQPIDGSAGHYLTNFTEGQIINFSLSLNGKQIAYSRGKRSTDILLIQEVP